MALNVTGENVVTQVQDRLKTVYNLVADDLPVEHNKCAATITAINKVREKMASGQDDQKPIAANKAKLKSLCGTALAEAYNEEKVIRAALTSIYEIYAIKNERRHHAKTMGNKEPFRRGALMKALQVAAQTMPLWMSAVGDRAPPLCGAIPADPTYAAEVGHMVAALQKSPEGDENWILAEVVSYNATTTKYEVDDIDEEQKDRITLSRRRVIPLPLMRANPETNPEALFRKNSKVMALYPQTTCFYKAIVNNLPTTPLDEYEVLFEDSSYPEGYSPPLKVAQRYVIATKRTKATKS